MNILITGADSYIGTNVEHWIKSHTDYQVDTLDTMAETWREMDFAPYDVVFHVAGIAHRKATCKDKDIYFSVNRDLALLVAQKAKEAGVKQFIFMSSMSVFHGDCLPFHHIIAATTPTQPKGFYGESKLQAENGLHNLECNTFKVCILRAPMVYGNGAKGNFPRLIRLATRTPLFPKFHNQRSMLYIDNLAEFVLQAITHQLSGTFYPQNRELSDTIEMVRYFAKTQNHTIWFSRWLNPFVKLASHFIQPVNKLFGTYYYDPAMSKAPFEYQLVTLEESLKRIK
jgi:UDP-glucose 4-epimerase